MSDSIEEFHLVQERMLSLNDSIRQHWVRDGQTSAQLTEQSLLNPFSAHAERRGRRQAELGQLLYPDTVQQ
jgi:hypothetical protein